MGEVEGERGGSSSKNYPTCKEGREGGEGGRERERGEGRKQ